jgi:8-oxo-dGTP pyrophosphatase MutT (NUDIX family)
VLCRCRPSLLWTLATHGNRGLVNTVERSVAWELPGGGIDAGEAFREAVVRELAEEGGIAAAADQVGQPTWRRRATFRYRGERRINNEVIVLVRLPVVGPAGNGAGRVGFEPLAAC